MHEPADPASSPVNEALETVRICLTQGDAEIVAARLRSVGIDVLVRAEDEGGLNPGFYADYAVRVLVRGGDLEAARTELGIGPIGLHPEILEAVRQHSRFCAPEEACGLLAVDESGGVRMAYACTNTDHSSRRFTVAPEEHYHAWRHAARRGWEIGGVFHSHPLAAAALSPTDVAKAADHSWLYLVIGGDGAVKAFRIPDGTAIEVEIV